MAKYGVMVKEILSKSIIVEAGSYEEAEEKVMDAYAKGFLTFNYGNSDNYMDEPSNDTDYYVSIFGEDGLEELEQDEEITKFTNSFALVGYSKKNDSYRVIEFHDDFEYLKLKGEDVAEIQNETKEFRDKYGNSFDWFDIVSAADTEYTNCIKLWTSYKE